VRLRWLKNPVSTAGEIVLRGLDCPSSSMCIAVGARVTIDAGTGQSISTIYSAQILDGAWREIPAQTNQQPDPTGAGLTYLNTVGCISATDCWAVGGTSTGVPLTMLVHFDGTQWTPWAGPYPGSVFGLTCVGGGYCIAASTTGELKSHGDSWTPVTPPAAAILTPSCPAADNCLVFGGTAHGLAAYRFDGSTWHTISSGPYVNFPTADPDGQPIASPIVERLTCASTDHCVAAITVTRPGGGPRFGLRATLGPAGWTLTANRPNDIWTSLTCVNTHYCWVVGMRRIPDIEHARQTVPAIAEFDGVRWTDVPVTDESIGGLNAVSCLSATLCYTVGEPEPSTSASLVLRGALPG
jgi:hypothetical protein